MVFTISGPIAPGEIGSICERLNALIDGGVVDIVVDVAGIGCPDLVAVDTLARLQLLLRRSGRTLVIRRASPELLDLLDLAGLKDVVSP